MMNGTVEKNSDGESPAMMMVTAAMTDGNDGSGSDDDGDDDDGAGDDGRAMVVELTAMGGTGARTTATMNAVACCNVCDKCVRRATGKYECGDAHAAMQMRVINAQCMLERAAN